MVRLFVAVWLPDDVIDALCGLHRKDQRGVRFVAPENWHVTLRFLGEARPGEVAAALDATALPAATARLGPAVDVLDERAVVVPVGGLDELAGAVSVATRSIGGAPPRKRFVGHVTLARVKRGARLPRALGELIAAEFAVETVSLVQSRLHPDGARYETLATWPTSPPPR